MHPVDVKVQGTLQQEEWLREEDHLTVIHRVAVLIHLHLHLRDKPRINSQEEQATRAEVQELR